MKSDFKPNQIEKGSLFPKTFITLPVEAPGCTTAWKVSKIFDDFEEDEEASLNWNEIGQSHLTIQFNFEKFYFNDEDVLVLRPNSKLKMKID